MFWVKKEIGIKREGKEVKRVKREENEEKKCAQKMKYCFCDMSEY